MKSTLTTIQVILSALFVFSCGGSASDKPKDVAVSEIKESENMDSKGGNTCLLGYSDKLDQLLTLDAAAGFTALPANAAKVSYSKVMKNTASHSIKYSWIGDRKRSMKDAGMDMVLPVKEQIELHGIKEKTLTEFKASHRAPTNEEIRKRDKAVNDALDGKSGKKEINENLEKLDKMKVDKSTQKGVAQNMGNVFAKVAMAYEDVAGLGDAASWNSFERRLYVLDNGVEISLSVDLSADESVNKKKAVLILTQLLSKCD
ncbi:hypothetical protein [Dyadobacter psychrotolerans]|uniref:Lipoprotein n=1 Tax=Dyadobacter psychrotolerans TaxID=2541721 RepID=A0A4V2Z4U1_9BACT|nr:hypothetical protein [Dyadobacter psychrotolerans]TDE18018.1 hypothetical protein E0F88_00220 [Dyadobacter psychrotolerans]